MKILIKESTDEIIGALNAGKVVVLPTDTVYGLFCDGRNKGAVKKIFRIKNRSADKPLGIFTRDVEMAKEYAEIDKKQEKMLKKHWPGRVTFVLKKIAPLPNGVGTKDTIGIRIPDYSLFKEIFKAINFPLAQTSANLSGRPCLLSGKEVIKQFENRAFQPDLILDAGSLPLSKPSSVIDLTCTTPKILRKGGRF